jgi:hypothetical protein
MNEPGTVNNRKAGVPESLNYRLQFLASPAFSQGRKGQK